MLQFFLYSIIERSCIWLVRETWNQYKKELKKEGE